MTNKEMIIQILNKYSCLTSFEIKGFVYRTFNINITPQSASGVLRPLISQGYVGKSISPSNGKTVYWLTDIGRKELVK